MDKETQDAIDAVVTPLVESAAAFAVAAAAAVIAANIFAPTNMHTKGIIGDKELHPTVTATNLSESNVAVSSAEGKLSHDEVHAQQGEVKASTLDATAQDGEATALESGASAVRTKAGATDIEMKALKMT
jgi:hypothetical protein